MAPRDADRTLPLPTSALFDPTLPMLATHGLSLRAPVAAGATAAGTPGAGAGSGAGSGSAASNGLRLTLTPRSEVQEPGTEAHVDISLTDADGAPVAGEVTLFAVDRAFLQLKAHPPLDLPAAFVPDLSGAPYRLASSFEQLVSAAGLSYSAAALLARLTVETGGEPWLSPSWPLRPSADSIVERELQALLAAHRHELTAWGDTYGGRGRFESGYGGGGDMPLMAEASFAMSETMSEDSAAGAPPSGLRTPGSFAGADDADDADGEAGGAGGGGGGGGALSVRSGLVATPLFLAALQIDESGLASVPWQVRRPRVLAIATQPPFPPALPPARLSRVCTQSQARLHALQALRPLAAARQSRRVRAAGLRRQRCALRRRRHRRADRASARVRLRRRAARRPRR